MQRPTLKNETTRESYLLERIWSEGLSLNAIVSVLREIGRSFEIRFENRYTTQRNCKRTSHQEISYYIDGKRFYGMKLVSEGGGVWTDGRVGQSLASWKKLCV